MSASTPAARPRLQVIVCSTRPGRVGATVADWFVTLADAHGGFEVERVDLAEVALPMFDEPEHPSLQHYQHAHTQRWSATIQRGDAYVFVTPEYNYGPPPPLVNALNYLYREWNFKAAGFVSYGGISGGLRSTQMIKQTLGTLKMVPIVEQVSLHFIAQQLDEERRFAGNPQQEKAARIMLDELLRWSGALRTLRTPAD